MIGVALGCHLVGWRKPLLPDQKSMPGTQAKILVYWMMSMVVLMIPIPAAFSLFYPKWFGELWAASWRFFYAYFFGMFICHMEIAREGIFYDFFSSPKWYFFSRINFATYRLVWLSGSISYIEILLCFLEFHSQPFPKPNLYLIHPITIINSLQKIMDEVIYFKDPPI